MTRIGQVLGLAFAGLLSTAPLALAQAGGTGGSGSTGMGSPATPTTPGTSPTTPGATPGTPGATPTTPGTTPTTPGSATGGMTSGSTGGTTEGIGTAPLQGTISGVSGNDLTLQGADGSMQTLQADAGTQVFLNGQPIDGLASIPEGSQVRASFAPGAGDIRRLTRIDVLTARRRAARPAGPRCRSDGGVQPSR